MPGFIHSTVVTLMKLTGSRHILEKEFRKNRVARQRPKPKQTKRYAIGQSEFEDWPVWTFDAPKNGEPILYYLHGGGFITGMLHVYFETLGRLSCAANMPVIAPDYPMPPDTDLLKTRLWTLTHFLSVVKAYPDSSIIVAGDSAGANLALGLAQQLKSNRRGKVSSLYLLYPWLDLMRQAGDYTLHRQEALLFPQGIREAAIRAAGALPLDDPRVSPIFGDLDGLPPIHIVSGDKDMLFPDAEDIENRARTAGILKTHKAHRGYGHDFWLLPTPDGRRELHRLAKDIASA